MEPVTSTARERFLTVLTGQFERLFETPAYARVASVMTPAALALNIVEGLERGSADKDGDGVKATCKALGVKCTYKAIAAFLKDGSK